MSPSSKNPKTGGFVRWVKEARLPGPVRVVARGIYRSMTGILGAITGTTYRNLIHLETRFDEMRNDLAAHKQENQQLHARLANALAQTENSIEYTVEQLDLLKSSLEMSAEALDEYQDWKASHPLPARPLVSICIPTYNRSRLLVERSLASLQRQTYDHWEAIVVGDGCTDDTAERIAALGDSRIRFVNMSERGKYPRDPKRRWYVAGIPNANHALTLAQGDFITHLDDDDEHVPDRLEKLVAFAREKNCDFVWHPFFYENENGDWLINPSEAVRVNKVTTSSIFYRSWLKRIPWNLRSHLLMEPGDWNRIRRFKFLGIDMVRYPEPLLRHFRERNQRPAT